jgi:hypothetical protein
MFFFVVRYQDNEQMKHPPFKNIPYNNVKLAEATMGRGPGSSEEVWYR